MSGPIKADGAGTILDLVGLLVSRGLSMDVSLSTAAEVDRLFGLSARASAPTEAQRKKWREKKQRQRARKSGVPGGHDPKHILTINESKIQSSQKKVRKSETDGGTSPGDINDGWPEDFLDQFWKLFPPYRRESKKLVGAKLAKLRKEKTVEWENLIEAVRQFAATNPGEYAPAPLVWLNKGRWDREYGSTGGANAGPNRANGVGGSADVFTAAARRRTGSAFGRDGRAPGAEDPASHGRRSDAPGSDPRGSEEFAFDLDLRAERVDPVRR